MMSHGGLEVSIRHYSYLYNEQFSIGNQILQSPGNVTVLFITDSALKFNSHIDSNFAKAHLRASLRPIHKCFVSKHPALLTRVFKVYVRPLVEYASCVWSPYYGYATDKVESVQRRFTKRLHGLRGMEYPTRLNKLNLQSLEYQRLVADLTLPLV